MSGDDMPVNGGGVTGASRRTPRQGVGGSPVGSTLTIVLAVVAVVVGFLILRNLTDTESAANDGGVDNSLPADSGPTTTFDSGVTTTIEITTTTTTPLVTEGATVVVANGNTIGGSAGRMSDRLAAAGYNMGTPTNAANNINDSIVYYDPSNTAAQGVAESVARSLGNVPVEPVGTPAPTSSGSLDGAGVVLVLGNNEADKTLEQLAEEAGAAGGESTLGTAPSVAGDTTPVDENDG